MSGPGASAECRGPAVLSRRSLCRDLRRGPALFVSEPGALCRGPALLLTVEARRSLCRGPALCVGAAALCVGARHSLCRGPALCVGVRRSLRRGQARLLSVGARALCFGARRCLPWHPALSGRRRGPAVYSVSGPGALCVGARRSLCRCRRTPALFVSGPGGRLPALFLLRPGALCRGPTLFVPSDCRARRSLCRGPARLECRVPALLVSGPGAPCIWKVPAVCVSAPVLSVAVCVGARRSSSGFACVGAERSVSGPGALCVGARRSLCRGPALFVSGPGAGTGALCVGPRCSLCWLSFYRAPAISVRVCLESELFLYRSSALGALCGADALRSLFVSGPGALCRRVRAVRRAAALSVGPQRSLCRGPALCVASVGARRRFLCQAARHLTVGPALCLGARRSLPMRGVRIKAKGPGCWMGEAR